MSRTKLRALAGAYALIGVSGLAAAANAQNTATNTVYGGGSTLIAPYWTQAAKCWDSANTAYYRPGVISPANPQTAAQVAATSTPVPLNDDGSQVCATVVTSDVNAINYDATGSGSGVAGLFGHDAAPGTPFSPANSLGLLTSTSAILFGTSPSDTTGAATDEVYPSIQYGLSDIPLVDTDVAVYTDGTGSSSYISPSTGLAVSAPSSYQGLTFSGFTAHAVGSASYPAPKNLYGALVQFPISVDPIVLAYNQVYKISSGVNLYLQVANPDGLHLDSEAYCKIFDHQITDWNAPYLVSLNGGATLLDPRDPDQTGVTSHPITLVGRFDSSGTTSILTRHLAAVCGTWTSDYGSAGVTHLPSAVSSFYTLANGDQGVAAGIHGIAGGIGYLGPSYALPRVLDTIANSYGLNVASLSITTAAAGANYVEPTFGTALIAFGSITPPQSNSSTDGSYNASNTTFGVRTDPAAWVQSTQATGTGAAPLAKPTAAGSYPIVGTTNFVAYTCYAAPASVTELEGFVNFGSGTTGNTVLNNAGLGALPTAWKAAILNTFLENNGDAHALNLWLSKVSGPGHNSTCTGLTGG